MRASSGWQSRTKAIIGVASREIWKSTMRELNSGFVARDAGIERAEGVLAEFESAVVDEVNQVPRAVGGVGSWAYCKAAGAGYLDHAWSARSGGLILRSGWFSWGVYEDAWQVQTAVRGSRRFCGRG